MTKQSEKSTERAGDLPKLAAPAQRALAAAGITHLKQLTRWSEQDLAQLHGMGPNALHTLRVAMAERGLHFVAPTLSHDKSARANQKITRREPSTKK